MHDKKLIAPKGVGVGSIFSGLIREVIPVSKSSIENLNKVIDKKSIKLMGKTLQQEATNTAVNDTLHFLNKSKVKRFKKKQLKKVAKNILSATKQKKEKIEKSCQKTCDSSTTKKNHYLNLKKHKKLNYQLPKKEN